MHYRKIYFAISATVIAAGVFALVKWGLPLGLDFTGGTIGEYKVSADINQDELKSKLKEVQAEALSASRTSSGTYLLKFPSLPEAKKTEIFELVKTFDDGVEELRFEIVGPSIGPELIQKTVYAAGVAAVAILLLVAIQFRSISFGASAILATLHDSLVLIGSFALLGHLFGAEVDFLFVTALLTTLSFSVHDTIVVFDRIRERKKEGENPYDLANKAVSETMVRSLNNSFTIIFMLFSLVLMGGETTRWFGVALFIGTVSGTYSSPFVAVPVLVTFNEAVQRFKKK